MRPNPRASAVASNQLGLITLRQARAAGMTEDEIRWCVRAGLWERVHWGVYRFCGVQRSWRQDLLAACLAADGPVMASHRAAAVLWGLADRDLEVKELTVPRQARPIPRGVIVHRLSAFREQDMSLRDGIPVTNPPRTILDLGAVAPHAVRQAVDVATSKRLVAVSGLRAIVDEAGGKGRAGAGVLRAVLDELGTDRTESVMEARFRRELQRGGVPLPVSQYEVRERGRFVARVDFADPDLLLAWEMVGYEFHSTYEAMQHDERRRLALTRLGWEVHCLFWARLVNAPQSVVAEVTEARRRRSKIFLGTKTGG